MKKNKLKYSKYRKQGAGMKAFILGMDINRATCDPSLYPDANLYTRAILQQLDHTATRIADFNADARGFARFIWAMQQSETRPGMERAYSPAEMSFHRVTPFPMDDDFLPKTQMSPYPEHRDFFHGLYHEGYRVGIIEGFHASKCVSWGLEHLANKANFKMLVVPALIGEGDGTHPLAALEDDSFVRSVYEGKIIVTDQERAMDFLYTPEDRRSLPRPTMSGEDLNSMYYGFGG